MREENRLPPRAAVHTTLAPAFLARLPATRQSRTVQYGSGLRGRRSHEGGFGCRRFTILKAMSVTFLAQADAHEHAALLRFDTLADLQRARLERIASGLLRRGCFALAEKTLLSRLTRHR